MTIRFPYASTKWPPCPPVTAVDLPRSHGLEVDGPESDRQCAVNGHAHARRRTAREIPDRATTSRPSRSRAITACVTNSAENVRVPLLRSRVPEARASVPTSTAVNGSSRNTTSGSTASARATAMRCRMLPKSSAGNLSKRVALPTGTCARYVSAREAGYFFLPSASSCLRKAIRSLVFCSSLRTA